MRTVHDKEFSISGHRVSMEEMLFFLISGIVTSVPLTLFAGTFTDSLCVVLPLGYATICSVAIFTPFIEEFAKAYPLFYRHCETERSLFSLGFLVGLGFGLTEFFVYVMVLSGSVLIRLPGVFFHAASTSITAYGIATRRTWVFYLLAVVLHFANNVAAIFDPIWVLVGPVAIALTCLCSWYLYRRTSERFIEDNRRGSRL
jgi:RsiW-degrading membrane proteinase PrsW (M82 family)